MLAYVHFLLYFEGTDLATLAHLLVRIGSRDRNRSAIKTRRYPSSSHKLKICGSPIMQSLYAAHLLAFLSKSKLFFQKFLHMCIFCCTFAADFCGIGGIGRRARLRI